jgi:hypothetical protein
VRDTCGLQVFFRGKTGIARLRRWLAESDRLAAGPAAHTPAAVTVFHRLEHLRAQKRELEQRRGLLFTDEDLEHAIEAVNHDIERLRRVLDEMSDGSKS